MRLYSDKLWLGHEDVALIPALDPIPVTDVDTSVDLNGIQIPVPILIFDGSVGKIKVVDSSTKNSDIIDMAKAGSTIGVTISSNDSPEWIQSKIFAGVAFFRMDVKNYSSGMAAAIRDFKYLFPTTHLMVNCVNSWDQFLYLSQFGADSILICEGLYKVPLVSTLMEIYEKAERWGLSTSIVAAPDAEITLHGDSLITLLAAGADAVHVDRGQVSTTFHVLQQQIAKNMADLGIAKVSDIPLVTEYVVKK